MGLKPLSENEVRVYQSRLPGGRYHIQTAGGFRPPFSQLVDASDLVSLSIDPEIASFRPDTLAMEDGVISLAQVYMELKPFRLQTRNGEPLEASMNLTFQIDNDPKAIRKLISSGSYALLGSKIVSACRVAITGLISKLSYNEALEHRSDACEHVKKALEKTLTGRPTKQKPEVLGLKIGAPGLQIFDLRSETAHTDDKHQHVDFSVTTELNKLIQFFLENRHDPDAVDWATQILKNQFYLETIRILSNGDAPMMISIGDEGLVSQASLQDRITIGEGLRSKPLEAVPQIEAKPISKIS